MKYKRILLKLSGEALAGPHKTGIDFDTVLDICSEIKEVAEMGVEVAIVVGGGNFWRGRSNQQLKQDVRVQTGVEMRQIAEFYIKDRATKHLEKGRVVVFGCGTGSPFFSTDTAAALRANEINADAVLKATNVDAIYDKDPKKYDDAIKIEEITYLEVINKKINVMDTTATSLCMDNDIPIIVFDINKKHNLKKVIEGKKIGTTVSNKK